MNKYYEKFTQWQNYAHYLLLDIFISLVARYYGAPIDLKMFAILYGALFVGDSIVHGIFYILPKPLRWRD